MDCPVLLVIDSCNVIILYCSSMNQSKTNAIFLIKNSNRTTLRPRKLYDSLTTL